MNTQVKETLSYYEADQIYRIKQAFRKMKQKQKPRRVVPLSLYGVAFLVVTAMVLVVT